MEKFEVNERVVVAHDTGRSSSGKVIRILGNDTYLVSYMSEGGWQSGEFGANQLTSMGVNLFLVAEAFEAHQSELEEVSDLC